MHYAEVQQLIMTGMGKGGEHARGEFERDKK